ncbi:uncharacterized protein LOC143143294 isoform X1 [Ptiloglossa arizonensis]|uniref:uncharacterized protein LOC143143294 isoform X1 n=1 Tax=Ptiloglossa arizonensis TaxID=3350558 RepID=UPI003FA12F11
MRVWLLVWLHGMAVCTYATREPMETQTSSTMRFDREAIPTGREWSWQIEDAQRDTTDKKNVPESNAGIELVDDKSREQRSAEAVIEEILVSNRQGRNIEGYDQVYADPAVKNALQLGNDTIARTYIRDKLCNLGLMNCENVEGRRPYYSPHRGIYPQDIIYAQPVTIKPVGRPLPAIPVKRPYGPPKPVPPPLSPPGGFISSGPSSDLIYGIGGPPPPPPSISHFGPYPGLKKPGLVGSTFPSSKPVYEFGAVNEGFDYDGNDRFIDKKQIGLRPSILGTDPVQQHVHHHYHHGETGQIGAANPPIYGQSYGTVGTSYDLPGTGIGIPPGGFQDVDDYKKAFKVKGTTNKDGNAFDGFTATNNYAERYPVYEKPMREIAYGKSDGQKTGKYYASGNYLSSNTAHATNNDYTFGSSPVGAPSVVNNNYYGQNLYENDENDCVCLPYEQCLGGDHAGRKDDLFLPIDPRNLNKNIEAESMAEAAVMFVAGNGTSSKIVRASKDSESTTVSSSGANQRTKRRAENDDSKKANGEGRQFLAGSPLRVCGPGLVCCPRRQPTTKPRPGQCGIRYTQGINGRIKTPANVDGDAEFGEYPWQVAILKKDPTESVYVCGGTLVSPKHILTAAHCVKMYAARDLRVRLGEWDVNHDVEFYPYIERDVAGIHVHPEFYAGTLYNDIAILRIDHQIDFQRNPHVSPACLPDKRDDFARSRCWTTGWGKDAFGDFGKYQNILKEVDVPVVSNQICEQQMRRTRLGPGFDLHAGFICAGGEEGKDACKGDGGGPMVCERHGRWQLAGIVSWGIGCGQAGVPGVYSRVSHYLDWIQQIVNRY